MGLLKIRPHIGSLKYSMMTLAAIPNNIDSVSKFVSAYIGQEVGKDMLRFRYYGFDPRTNWDTYIISVEHPMFSGVFGFCDQKPLEMAEKDALIKNHTAQIDIKNDA